MKTKAEKNEHKPEDIGKMIRDSEMWMVINLDKEGIHFRSSNHEEGLALIALIMASNENAWGIVKEYVNKIKISKKMNMN
jgi:hypothetical protein